MLRKRAS